MCGQHPGSGVHPAHGSIPSVTGQPVNLSCPSLLGTLKTSFLTLGVHGKVHCSQKSSLKRHTHPNNPCKVQLSPLLSGPKSPSAPGLCPSTSVEGGCGCWAVQPRVSTRGCSPGTDPRGWHNLLLGSSFLPHYPQNPRGPSLCRPCSRSFSELCCVKSFLFPARMQVEGRGFTATR